MGNKELICGIYKITNKINGHIYIGLSKNILKRFKDHQSHLNSKRIDDKNKALYKALRKYGCENFTYEIIEECPEELLKEREVYWIKFYNTYEDKKHYNLTPGGDLPGFNTIHLGEKHGMAKLNDEDVIYCRKAYAEGQRSTQVWKEKYSCKINYGGFLRMWHGQIWKHIMPEVFKNNPHPGKYSAIDRDIIQQLYKESGLSLNAFQKTEDCYVGYGTLWKMINTPEFYNDK